MIPHPREIQSMALQWFIRDDKYPLLLKDSQKETDNLTAITVLFFFTGIIQCSNQFIDGSKLSTDINLPTSLIQWSALY